MSDGVDPRKADWDVRPNGYTPEGFGGLDDYRPEQEETRDTIGEDEARFLLLSRLGGIAGFVQSTTLLLAYFEGDTPEGFLWILGRLTILSGMVFFRNGVISALVLAGFLALGVARNIAGAVEGDFEIAWGYLGLYGLFLAAFLGAAWAGWRLYKDHGYPNPFEEWD